MRAWTSKRRPKARRPHVVHLGDEHGEQVARRRAAASRMVGSTGEVAARVGTAPPGYVLAHNSSDIVRHCELLSPVPAVGEARVVLTPGRVASEWHLDVASRDRPGLLAAFTGVLAASGIDVVQAVVATWDDGAALEAFVVRSPESPDASFLQDALETSLGEPLTNDPVAGAEVTFDDSASALYTRCDVRAADRHGLLHDVATAIVTAGADIHAAAVSTVDGMALDRFDLSDQAGNKLDPELMEAIHTHITGTRPVLPEAAFRGESSILS